MKKTTKWILLAGVAGVGWYMYDRHKKGSQVVAVATPPEGPPPRPSLFGDAIKSAAKRYAELEVRAKSLGVLHHGIWKKAMKAGQLFYMYGHQCYSTITISPVSSYNCRAMDLE